jgi:CBS domain-containing protein
MESISQVLGLKGRNVWSVEPQDQVFEAIRVMAEKGIGALLVIGNDRLVGIVSERDYARKVILKGKSSKSTLVEEIMTADPVTVTPHQSVDDCLSIMTARGFRHLPVVDGDEVVGVLSLGDLVRSIIDDQKHQINSLEQYIAG